MNRPLASPLNFSFLVPWLLFMISLLLPELLPCSGQSVVPPGFHSPPQISGLIVPAAESIDNWQSETSLPEIALGQREPFQPKSHPLPANILHPTTGQHKSLSLASCSKSRQFWRAIPAIDSSIAWDLWYEFIMTQLVLLLNSTFFFFYCLTCMDPRVLIINLQHANFYIRVYFLRNPHK